MNKPHLLALVIISIVFVTGCKKAVSNSSSDIFKNTNFATAPAMAIPLTIDETKILREIFKQRKLTSPADYITIVDSVKSATGRKKTGNAVASTMDDDPSLASDYTASEDVADFSISNAYPSTYLYEDWIDWYIRLQSRFEQHLTFNIRANKIMVIVPFQYDWKAAIGGYGGYYIDKISPDLPVQLLPEGPFWGEVNQVGSWYLNGGVGDAYFPDYGCPVTAYAAAEEKRTQIVAVNGRIKISTNVDLGAFGAGVELEQGFVVSTAYHTYNNYTMDADGLIQATNRSALYGSPTRFVGTCVAHQWGILKNQ